MFIPGVRSIPRRALLLAALLTVSTGAATRAQQPPPEPTQPASESQPPSPQPAPQPSDIQRPTFRAGVDVVSLNVTVTDSARNFVTDLERDDFLVFEDGVKQELTFFTKAQLPVALSLLIDTSASMEDKLAIAQEAAIGFVRRMKPDDIAQIIDFDSRVSILEQFTNDRGLLEAAIRRTVPNGSTSLHNAIYISLKEL
ncbi:MAG TPA: VWA domain-containing protein, partial [Vicinamibacterales bacterium]